ncbi:MAG TPA: hypothetical protein VGI00_13490 [Streptosporangiaceae bacterium]|jgi:hypothetical protein
MDWLLPDGIETAVGCEYGAPSWVLGRSALSIMVGLERTIATHEFVWRSTGPERVGFAFRSGPPCTIPVGHYSRIITTDPAFLAAENERGQAYLAPRFPCIGRL